MPIVLSVVCELDDTFVLDSYKGTKLPKDFWRKPRKHGAVAQKPGISNEYVCISTGVSRNGGNIANSFHSFIIERYNQYRGVATKYLNRYNALFAKLFRSNSDLADEI